MNKNLQERIIKKLLISDTLILSPKKSIFLNGTESPSSKRCYCVTEAKLRNEREVLYHLVEIGKDIWCVQY